MHSFFVSWKPLLICDILDLKESVVLTFFAPRLGSNEAAAWIILCCLWESLLGLTKIFGEVTASRVDILLGLGKHSKARTIADTGLVYGILFSICVTIVLLCVSVFMQNALVENGKNKFLRSIIADFLPIFGTIFLPAMIANICWSVIVAQQNYYLASFVIRGSTWFISIPLGIGTAIRMQIGLSGFVGAVAVNYLISAFILWNIVLTTNWLSVACEVQAKNAARGKKVNPEEDYDDDDSAVISYPNWVLDEHKERSVASDAIDEESVVSDSTVSVSNVRRKLTSVVLLETPGESLL